MASTEDLVRVGARLGALETAMSGRLAGHVEQLHQYAEALERFSSRVQTLQHSHTDFEHLRAVDDDMVDKVENFSIRLGVTDALTRKYIQEALDLFGGDMDVLFSTHNWPRFGRADAVRYLELQRDMYRWLHDQTMRRANHGMTMREIAEEDHQNPEVDVTPVEPSASKDA